MIKSWGNVAFDENPRFEDIKHTQTHILPIGNCRSYGDVCIADTNHAYGLATRYNRLIAFDKTLDTLTVEAGITLREILEFIQPQDYVLMVTPGTSFATVGGCIANDVHGKNHETVGSFAETLVDFSLKLPLGDIIKCSRDENADIFWATVGGLGLTGTILTATLKLKPVDNTVLTVTRTRHKNLKNLMEAMDKFKNAPYCVAWIDTTGQGSALGRGVLEVAHHAHEGIFVNDTKPPKTVPFYLPDWALNKNIVKVFNHFYYNRSVSNKQNFESFEQFQYPLDKILNWNKLYGKQGFYQFQSVVPFDDAELIIKNILTIANKSGFASPLSVLKRLGEQNQGLLSFPQAGYTLAFDIPARNGTKELMQHFESLVLEVKGRIYPAKDALMSAVSFEKMYPNKQKFLDVLKNIQAQPISKAAHRYGLIL